eukprot:gene26754-4329_t
MGSWSPYDDNGGTILAVAGEDFCIIAASTRLSTGYSILTRDSSKLLRLAREGLHFCIGLHALFFAEHGSGKELMQPVLDNQLAADSPLLMPSRKTLTALPLDHALDLVKGAFVAAGERDIYTGDAVEIMIMTKEGIRTERMDLKLD